MNYNIKEIVNSLFSENVNEDYVALYLNNRDIMDNCNKMISELLNQDFFNRAYDVDKCINFLNNVVKRELYDKPYLVELNIIINTIIGYIEKNKDLYYLVSSDPNSQYALEKENARLKEMLAVISNEFTDKQDINFVAEKKITQSYLNKIINNIPLSKEETEELISLYLSGCFSIYNEKDYDKIVIDYALKNVLEFDYKIDEFLYKKLFIYTCREELDKRKIKDISFAFNHSNELDYNMSFDANNKVILINNNKFKKNSLIENYISFFHELRHYEQYNDNSNDLISFLGSKDRYLSNVLSNKYYEDNYNSLFFEKDATYNSYESAYNFIKEKSLSSLPKLKSKIYEKLIAYIELENKNINKRSVKNETDDINLLFDKALKENKNFLHWILSGNINSSLLVEYDISGEKRSVFELLSDKEFEENNGNNLRMNIYNYLLYEENVSLDYILKNLKLFEDSDNKKMYGKYYKEAKQVLKHKLIGYYSHVMEKKSDKLLNKGYILMPMFYEALFDNLKKVNIKGLKKDKNVKLYREKNDELFLAYKWLYNLISEIEEENVEKIKNGKLR